MQIKTRVFMGCFLIALSLNLYSQEAPLPSNLWPEVTAPKASDSTSQKIIELHLKARGGKKRLENIQSVRFSGTIVEGLVDHSIVATYQRPGSLWIKKYRYHLGYDQVLLSATDGSTVWQRVTSPEKQLPRTIGGDPAKQMKFDAILPFLFLEPDFYGFVYAYAGEKTIASRKAYVLHGWRADGLQIEVFFDHKSFHVINYRYPQRIGSVNVLVDQMPTGLKQLDGVWWETGASLQHRGKVFQKLSFETIETNVAIDEDLFTMPKVKEFWLRPKREG